MVPAARAALERLLADSAPGGRVSLDAIAEAVGASAVTQLDVEAIFDGLEAAGREIWAPDEGAAMPLLGRVLAAARALRQRLGAAPPVDLLAREAGCSVGEVRRALLLGRVLAKGTAVPARRPDLSHRRAGPAPGLRSARAAPRGACCRAWRG
jgi:hypothetical protein